MFGRLQDMKAATTGDAMGMNMVLK